MKKIALIFLSLQLMSGNMFAEEIAKLPLLIHHYFEHQKSESASLRFSDFLVEHYFEDHGKQEDGSHEKLPFKHCHDCCTHQATSAAFTLPESVISVSHAPGILIIPSLVSLPYTLHVHNGIWQPPKVNV